MQRNNLQKKVVSNFLVKNETWVVRNFFIFVLFFNFFIYVFLVKLLNITSTDKNRNMHILYKKNSKVEQHSSKTFFWWPSSNFAIFSCKMSVTFESVQGILCLET